MIKVSAIIGLVVSAIASMPSLVLATENCSAPDVILQANIGLKVKLDGITYDLYGYSVDAPKTGFGPINGEGLLLVPAPKILGTSRVSSCKIEEFNQANNQFVSEKFSKQAGALVKYAARTYDKDSTAAATWYLLNKMGVVHGQPSGRHKHTKVTEIYEWLKTNPLQPLSIKPLQANLTLSDGQSYHLLILRPRM